MNPILSSPLPFPVTVHWEDLRRTRDLLTFRAFEDKVRDVSKTIEVIIWDPAGFGSSSFGHVSVVVRDGLTATSYSLAPGGCDVRPFADYLARQQFRNGYGLELRLTSAQADAVARYFEHTISCDYSLLGISPDGVNNCASPIQRALQVAGVPLNGFSLMPRGLGLNLWNRSLVARVISYQGNSVARTILHPPWVPASSAYPWGRAP